MGHDAHPKKSRSIFSVISKQFRKWRESKKLEKQINQCPERCEAEDPRDSCDADPRFSLDIGRMSFENPRVSICMAGKPFSGTQHLVPMIEEYIIPGGSAQTREYYSDSSSRRRNIFDRSSSMTRMKENEDSMKFVSNSKVSPAILDSMKEPSYRFLSNTSRAGDCDLEFRRRTRGWRILEFMHGPGGAKEEECGRNHSSVLKSFAPALQRSSSAVSWRNSRGFGNGDANCRNGAGFRLLRNRSTRYPMPF